MFPYTVSHALSNTQALDGTQAAVVLFDPGQRSVVVANITAQAAFVGTIKIQGSADGATWADLSVIDAQAGGAAANPTVAGNYSALAAANHIMGRVIFSAYTSGIARVRALAIPAV